MRPGGIDAGIGTDDVETPQFGHALVQHVGEARKIPYVGLGGDDAPIERFNLGHRLLEVVGCGQLIGGDRINLGADVDRHDVGAFLRQPTA